jgi:hypothetical protein
VTALPFIGADELRANTPSEPPWTWAGYIAPRSVTLLAARPKIGKSTLALAVAEAVAADAPAFLGRAINGGPVVFVAEEFAATLAHKTPATRAVRVLTGDAAWPKPSWPELVAGSVAEAERVGAVLLVVDTVPFWAALGRDAEKDAGAAQAMMQPLRDAARTGLAVLGVLHQRKGGGEDGEAVRGSGAITGAVDVVLELERGERPSERVLLALSRYPSTPGSLLIERDPETGAWGAIAEGKRGDGAVIGWTERILTATRVSGEGLTLDELGETLGADRRKWHPTLAKLLADESIARTGKGTRSDPYRHLRVSVPSSRPERRDGKDGKAAPFLAVPPPRIGGEARTAAVNDENGRPPSGTAREAVARTSANGACDDDEAWLREMIAAQASIDPTSDGVFDYFGAGAAR